MQIVIDIDDEDYKRIQDISDVFNSLTSRTYLAIRNGTQLPKGHGRLIDVDDIEWARHQEERNYIDYDVVDWDDIVKAPTILKADTSRKEQK